MLFRMFSNMNGMDFGEMAVVVLTTVAAVMVCMVFHELCHGLAAYALGDQTAKRMGRLTLNPLKHLDPIGSLLLLFAGFGWARPVQIDPRYFENPRRDMALTALAGPISNFLMAFLALGIRVHTIVWSYRSGMPGYALDQFLNALVTLNLGLGVFNLLPIPPLDGSKVLGVFLPGRIYWTMMQYERYGMFILLFLAMSGSLGGFLGNFVGGIYNLMLRVWR